MDTESDNIFSTKMKKAHNKYDVSWFLTLSTQELIRYCKDPPRDAEYNELLTAMDIMATRYADCLQSMSRF